MERPQEAALAFGGRWSDLFWDCVQDFMCRPHSRPVGMWPAGATSRCNASTNVVLNSGGQFNVDRGGGGLIDKSQAPLSVHENSP